MRSAPHTLPLLRMTVLLLSSGPLARAATLPQPCVAGSCLGGSFGAGNFVGAGAASATQAGNKLTVTQTSSAATLNWQSFNISADGAVQFIQPSRTAVALNQIADANPSQIFGSLTANGRVFLLNQNGIVFGSGAQVNVGGLLASTLAIDPLAVTNGLTAPGSLGNPTFKLFPNGASGPITIAQGASLQTLNGGEILLFAPQITNQGTISSPGGQSLLAAGSSIYLASSSDPALRGLLVEVGGTGGTATNGTASNAGVTDPSKLIGTILATDGNVTLAGLAVNQLGRVSATTSINQNGSIRLLAGDHGSIDASGTVGVSGTPRPGIGGTLIMGPHSLSDVTLDAADRSTTVDSVAQLKSSVSLAGAQIQMLDASVARATGGTIDVTAANALEQELDYQADGSRFYLAPNAELDVSGARITLPVSSNVIPVQLRGAEFADSPLQQNGPLRGQTVYVDIRQEGPLVNGVPSWVGTPLADVSGEIAAIGHNVLERNLAGGSITIHSQGDALLAPGSVVNVAGGQIQYTAGYIDTTNLVQANGQIVNIAAASPNVLYAGIANSSSVDNTKWGQSSTYQTTPGLYAAGYTEGKDAGALRLSAPAFVLDSVVNASAVIGPNQRRPDATVPPGALYRDPYEVPRAATLVIGGGATDFVVGNVTLRDQLVLPTLTNADGSPFDPTGDPLPATFTTSLVRPALMGSQGFGNLSVQTNGRFFEPADVALQLPGGGSFSAAASLIDLEGVISAPGGSIAATASATLSGYATLPDYALTVGSGARLLARGAWINDSPALNPIGNTTPLFIDGGSISLAALSNNFQYSPGLKIASGSLLDVSGGAQLTSSGALNAGRGGTITLAAQTTSGTLVGAPPRLDIAGTLAGYGVYTGGRLSLSSGGVCIATVDCSAGDSSVLWLSPEALTRGGFGSIALTADQGGLEVAPGTLLSLQQRNLLLPDRYALLSSAPSLVSLARVGLLPAQLRQPMNVSLTQAEPLTQNFGFSTVLTVTGQTPSLHIGAGAQLLGDPGASLSLTSNVRIIIDGSLRAPGGSISLHLGADLLQSSYSPTQAIWLGSGGVLDVSGTALVYPNALGQRSGSVLAGGTVTFNADRGYVELLPGSLINVSGTASTLDVAPVGSPVTHAEQVVSAAGSLSITTSEGANLGGTLLADAGVAAPGMNQPAGGSFSLTLDGGRRNDYALGFGGVSSFPVLPRTISVSANAATASVPAGTAVPDSQSGRVLVSAAALSAAGFDSISLRAAPLPLGVGTTLPGVIGLDGNVTLRAGRQITLDAAGFAVGAGATATLSAPFLSLGNSDQFYGVLPAVTGGTGTLRLSGGLIDLFGTTALQGIGLASFNASGDIRLRGLVDASTPGASSLNGGLLMRGDLMLSAQQVYPTTLSQFRFSTDPASLTAPTTGSILVNAVPLTSAGPLSAGGVLTLSAGRITQDGTLRAPLGQINLIGQDITLGAGSLTSTSANGLIIPFGTTQGGLDWVYTLANGVNVVFGGDGVAPPAQRVNLQGSRVDVAAGAVVDVSGGGDLFAYEWIPGTGGTRDVLSAAVRPNQFAIVPGLGTNLAPYDPAYASGSSLQPGQAVYLAGAPGLPAGIYPLLPARYALLPGAFLVTAVTGYTDIQPGQSFSVAGGGTVIAGYNTVYGTTLADSRTSGFQVVPSSVVQQQAQYTTSSANTFFQTKANSSGTPASRLPKDSGVLSLIAGDSLTLSGSLRTAASGLGAEVDISSGQILVAPAGTSTQSGQILLTPSSLGALGAQTLLLGGLHDGTSIQTTAQSVEVAAGATLSAPVVVLAARDSISVDSGAAIVASGVAPAARGYSLNGDGAVLSVSSGGQATLTRSGATGGSGTLNLAAGSSLSAPGGSVYLEASNAVLTDGALSLAGADIAVQSQSISLGSPPGAAGGTVLGAAVLSAQSLCNLQLVSAEELAFYGDISATAQNITLDAPGLAGFGGDGNAVRLLASGSVTLRNGSGGNALGAGSGSGVLQVQAGDLFMDGGAVGASGFATLDLRADGSVTARHDTSLSSGGSLRLTASRVTTAADVSLDLAATGPVALLSPSASQSYPAATALGGAINVAGSSVTLGTRIDLPSGRLMVRSTGDSSGGNLTLLPGAMLDLAGTVQTFDGVSVASPGGSVTLNAAGNLVLANGSSVDVSAGKGGVAGALALSAPGGTVNIAGTLAGRGGADAGGGASIDAQAVGDLTSLGALLDAAGFTGSQSLRQRGAGDLVLASGATLAANTVMLEADQGNVRINGTIDASGNRGGGVTLAASGDVVVTGAIQAQARAGGETGGRVTLETTGGQLQLASGSQIDVHGAGGEVSGSLWLRAPAARASDVIGGGRGVVLDGTVSGSARTTLEGVSVAQNTTGTIAAGDTVASSSNPLYAQASGFMSNADAITLALGQSGNSAWRVVPGLEIDATTASNGSGTLSLTTPWNLFGWRFGTANVPGVLTLRAENGITVGASLSDGFTAVSGAGAYTLPSQPSDSWSYRLVAGADFGAIDPLATLGSSGANLAIAAGIAGTGAGYRPVMVRTGNGFIDVAAAHDITFGNQQSLLYTAGVAGPGIVLNGRAGSLQGRAYPTGGGDIQLGAGHDIIGRPSNQFVNAWLWRVGAPANQPTATATAWTVDFQSFQQGVGALGGGNVSVRAGGDITDLSVSIPSIGVQVGGTTQANSVVQVTGGGRLAVNAGGSILGGSYYVDRGSSSLLAGGDIGAAIGGATGLSPLIGLGDTSFSATSRGNLSLAEILTPGLLFRGAAQGAGAGTVYFSTYSANSSARLTAIGGDLVLTDESADFLSTVSGSFLGNHVTDVQNSTASLALLPPTVALAALSGSVDIGRTLLLQPAANGTLQVFVNQNITAITNSSGFAGQMILSDADPAQLPTLSSPAVSLLSYSDLANPFVFSLADQHAPTPVGLGGDASHPPARIVALNGDLDFQATGAGTVEGIWSARPVDVVAGNDIVNLNLVAQNLGDGDVTSIRAGRDILYPQQRSATGGLMPNGNGVAVDGPGQLQISAGRNIDLGTSAGISTRANLVNPVLPPVGAGISMEAGVSLDAARMATFVHDYVQNSTQFDAALVDYMTAVSGAAPAGPANAKQQFLALDDARQRGFVEELFFGLLRHYGRLAAARGNNDFSGAYAALDALFPGANPNLASGQKNPYLGNIELYFSRVYTQQGGDIALLAPGGEINVGLAIAPASFGVNKAPDQLGIVAQTTGDVSAFSYSDFQVNQSRVFAADGGNILVWSTEGNIDAGRGAKTSLSAPALNIAYDANGQPTVTLRAAIAGSGVQALSATPGVSAGDVDLYAPHGVVNANDAGIVAGNLTVAATAVLGASNISVSGTSVGVPVAVTGLGAAFAGATSSAAATSTAAESVANSGSSRAAPTAEATLSWLEVFVTGLGESNCRPDDAECLRRELGGEGR